MGSRSEQKWRRSRQFLRVNRKRWAMPQSQCFMVRSMKFYGKKKMVVYLIFLISTFQFCLSNFIKSHCSLGKKPRHQTQSRPLNIRQYNGGAFSEKANFGFFERVLWKGKFWPKFSQNLPLQPKFAFSQNHWNMPKNWNLCPFRHSINFLDESHCKGTEELIQKNNWSHKKFSYFITERVKDSSF